MLFSSQTIKKILIPTDGSDYSIRAAEYGISIAKAHQAQITVVFVFDEVVIEKFSKMTERENVERDLKNDGQRYVNYILGLAQKEGVPATSLVVRGRPFEQIVHLANGLNMDLIVMGTYGRRGAERILIGSVAERVIEYSTLPSVSNQIKWFCFMKKKTKLDDDYKNFNQTIEHEAEEKIKAIEAETSALKEEADKIGIAVESSLKATEKETGKKKVNS